MKNVLKNLLKFNKIPTIKVGDGFKSHSENETLALTWLGIVVVTLVALVFSGAYSVSQFIYWNNLEGNLIPNTETELNYDVSVVDELLTGYNRREEELSEIIPDEEKIAPIESEDVESDPVNNNPDEAVVSPE